MPADYFNIEHSYWEKNLHDFSLIVKKQHLKKILIEHFSSLAFFML